MSAHSEPSSPASSDPEPSAQLDADAYAEMFDAHAAHLFDYCNRLLGDEAEAANATELALTTASSLLQDGDRLRAWLFALARRECLTANPAAADGLGYAAPTEVGEDLRDAEATDPDLGGMASRAFWRARPPSTALADRDREVLDLVYRHGIRPEDLPAILGVSSDRASELLTAAEAKFSRSANLATAGEADAAIAPMADMPLAALPASVWERTVGTELDADPPFSRWQTELTGPEPTARRGSAALPARARRRLRIAAAVLVPVAGTLAAVIYFFGPSPGPGAGYGTGDSPRTTTADPAVAAPNGLAPVPSSSSPHVQIRSLLPRRSTEPVGVVLPPPRPTPSRTAKSKPSTPPTSTPPTSTSSASTSSASTPPTSPSPSPSPSPSQSPDPS